MRRARRSKLPGVWSLVGRTAVPAVQGAALLADLFTPGRALEPLALLLLAGFTAHLLWRLKVLMTRSAGSELERAEMGLLAVLAAATAVSVTGLPEPWPVTVFTALILALAAAVPLSGLVALPPAAVLLWQPEPWLPPLVLLETVAVTGGLLAWVEHRRRSRLQGAYEKVRLDAEHLGRDPSDQEGDLSRVDDALYRLMGEVRESTRAHGAVLVLESPSGVPYVREVHTDARVRDEARLDMPGTAFQWIFENDRPLRIGNLRSPQTRLGYYAGTVAVKSFLGVPVQGDDGVEGVLGVDSLSADDFTDADAKALGLAAHQVATIFRQGQTIGHAKRRAWDFQLLHDFAKRVVDCGAPDDLLDLLLHTANERLQPHASLLVLLDTDGGLRVAATGEPETRDLVGKTFGIDEGLAGWVLTNGRYLHYDEGRDRTRRPLLGRAAPLPEFPGLLLQPLEAYGEAVGLLFLGSRTPRAFDPPAVAFTDLLAQQGAQALLHLRNISRLRVLATRDELTGLANRRVLFERLEAEVSRSRRYEHPLCLLTIDVDHFKQVNDRHGHPAGDVVLEQVARAILSPTRETDLAARHGGEEFAVVVPTTDETGARALAERIREAIEGLTASWEGNSIPVTASLGVSTLQGEGDTVEALVSRADRALYAAKEQGRNRVIAFSDIREYVSWGSDEW